MAIFNSYACHYQRVPQAPSTNLRGATAPLEPRHVMSLATELVAGGFAGAVGIMATQPLDTIRSAVAMGGRFRVTIAWAKISYSMLAQPEI